MKEQYTGKKGSIDKLMEEVKPIHTENGELEYNETTKVISFFGLFELSESLYKQPDQSFLFQKYC